MKKFQELKELIEVAEKDAIAFYTKGNKTAGTRLRGALQKAKQLAQELRQEVSQIKNSD